MLMLECISVERKNSDLVTRTTEHTIAPELDQRNSVLMACFV